MSRRAQVKVKPSPVTRVQAAAEFGRKKAKQRRSMWRKRALLAGVAAFAVYAGVGSWWLWHNGTLAQAQVAINKAFWQWTADAGFKLDQVSVVGRTHADASMVRAAVNVKQGEPLLAMDLSAMKQRLEKIPEVKTVTISRQLPNELSITLTERVPAAFWQHDGQQQLVDAQGIVLAHEKYQDRLVLPLMVGDDAPQHIGELLALLDSAPDIKPEVVAAVRVGQRRWNLQLKRDIIVMLPEESVVAAWKRFDLLVAREALLSKAIRSVDMRMEDRIFILPTETKANPITLTNARDT